MKLVFRIVACFAALILLAFLLAGCNMSLTPGNYNFKVVHICDGVKCCDVEISSWHESDTPGIEVKMKDVNSLFLSEGTYILAEDYCPICGGDGK